MEFAKSRGERRPLTLESLGGYFTALKAKLTRPRNVIVGEHLADVETPYGGIARKAKPIVKARASAYVVGKLNDARAAFSKVNNLPIAWDSTGDD